LINHLSAKDFRELGYEGKAKLHVLRTKLSEYFLEHKLNELIDDNLRLAIQETDFSTFVEDIDAEEEEKFLSEHLNVIPFEEYGDYKFHHTYYDPDTQTFWAPSKGKYKAKNIIEMNRKEKAVALNDVSGNRQCVYLDKFTPPI
jgi:hypothetical protein